MTKQELQGKNLDTIIELAPLDDGKIVSVTKNKGQLSINIKFTHPQDRVDFKNRMFHKGVTGTYMEVGNSDLKVTI